MSLPDAVADAETRPLLRLFAWGRLGVAQLLLVLAPLLPGEVLPARESGFLAALLLAVVVSSGILLAPVRLARPVRVASLVCLLDVALVTGLVAVTGGPRSIFAFLYVLTVSAACVLLPRRASLAIAAVGSLLYTGLVVIRTVLPLTLLLEPPEETTALEVLTIFVNAGTFLVVAIVAGNMAEQYRSSRGELEMQRRDLGHLQAFKAVVLQSLGTGLVVLDREYTVTALNPAAEAITGRRAEDVIGRPWTHLVGDAAPPARIEAALAEPGRASGRYETSLSRPDGWIVPVRLNVTALISEEGRRLGFIVVVDDLSEIREMERRVRQADRLATLGRLAANIAHEIRNPLASMSGAIEVLAADGLAREERQRLTHIVARESERLNRIIANFLDYARPAPLASGTCDVAGILDEVAVLLEHRDLPAALKITRDYAGPLPWRGDAQQLRQAVWNLCLNAIEAMPDGGELRVSALVDADTLRITVADTGTGIMEADLPHIFEPFYSTKPGGSGLGLALVHRIARDHGGDIDVRTSPGGTAFVLAVPRTPDRTEVAR